MSATRTSDWRRFRWVAAIFAAATALHFAWLASGLGGPRSVQAFSDVMLVVAPGVGAVTCWRAGRRRDERRAAWLLLGAGSLSWALGQAVWTFYELVQSRNVPFPSLADVGYLLFVPLAAAGVIAFQGRSNRIGLRLLPLMDGLIVGSSLLWLSWATVLEPVYHAGGTSLVERVIGLAYPVGDIVVVAAVLFIAGEIRPHRRGPLLLVGAGLLSFAGADTMFAYLTQKGAYVTGSLTDIMWTAGFLAIALAPFLPPGEQRADRATPLGPVSRVTTLVPFVPFLISLSMLAVRGVPLLDDPLLFWLAIWLVALVISRQLITIYRSAAFSRSLEAEVRIRTEELETERGVAEAHAGELAASQEIILTAAEGTTFEATVEATVATMARVLGYQSLAISIFDESAAGSVIRCVGAVGFPPSVVGRTLQRAEGVVGRCLESGLPQLVTDTREDRDYVEFIPGTRSEMCVPIRVRGSLMGVVDVESRDVAAFDEEDLDALARLAPHVGLMLTNAFALERERSAVERLTELDTMKSEFVAITSHELRTPLTSLSGFIKTLRRPEFQRDWGMVDQSLEVMDRQADRLIRLVEDLLFATGVETGGLKVHPRPVDVAELIERAIEELGDRGARVCPLVEDGLPPVSTDPERLAQILRNLLENALKFSPAGATVRLSARREGDDLQLEVQDHGTGIRPQEIHRIFEPFYQVEPSIRRRAGGFGLGLHITRMLADALEARLEVSSTVGEGSVFRLRLPIGESIPAGSS